MKAKVKFVAVIVSLSFAYAFAGDWPDPDRHCPVGGEINYGHSLTVKEASRGRVRGRE